LLDCPKITAFVATPDAKAFNEREIVEIVLGWRKHWVLNVKLANSTCSVVYVQMTNFHLNVFSVVTVAKICTVASPGSLLVFCTA